MDMGASLIAFFTWLKSVLGVDLLAKVFIAIIIVVIFIAVGVSASIIKLIWNNKPTGIKSISWTQITFSDGTSISDKE